MYEKELNEEFKDLILINKLAMIIAIILSMYFIYRVGKNAGETIYYLTR